MTFDGILGFVVGLVIATVTYFVGLQLGWITDFSYIEFFGVAFNYACVLLTARQSIACWPTGIIAVLFLGALFWHLGLYASMTLSLAYFLPIQFWGWYKWEYGGENKTELPISWMKVPDWGISIVVGLISWFVIAYVDAYFGAAQSSLDAGILVLSIIGQYLLGLKKPESWLFWIAVNIISVYVYSKSGANLLAFQYALFLGNAFYGFAAWTYSYLQERKHTAI